MLNQELLAQRLKQFTPEPLIDVTNLKTKIELELPMITDDNAIDLAKTNYLNVLKNPEIMKASEESIRKYGVGTCGPRAFYGTTDVHLELEQKLAEFLGVEESIIYSYGFVAISSSIAAYCKKSDVIFVDEEANFPIHQGLVAAKSKVVYFSHNDPNSLKIEAEKIVAIEQQKKKKTRKFLIIEAISWKTGKMCPIEEFLEIAEQFKMRVFLEESYTLGVIGETGKGITEHCNIDPSRVDMIFGTLEGAIGSIGGFCAGSNLIIEHQRLSGTGYIFSASLPTYLVKVVLKSLEILDNKPKRLVKLAEKFHQFLKDECKFEVMSDPQSPFKIFTMYPSGRDQVIHEFCQKNGVHFIRRDNDLMINLNVDLSGEHLERTFSVLLKAVDFTNSLL